MPSAKDPGELTAEELDAEIGVLEGAKKAAVQQAGSSAPGALDEDPSESWSLWGIHTAEYDQKVAQHSQATATNARLPYEAWAASGSGKRLAALLEEEGRRDDAAQQEATRPAGLEELGSYNDGHDFSGKPPTTPTPYDDLGTYNDGHSFGWKKPLAMIGVVVLLVGGVVVYEISQPDSTTPARTDNAAQSGSASNRSSPPTPKANQTAPIDDLRKIGTDYIAALGCPTVNEVVYDYAIANDGPSHAGQIATFQITGTVNETVRTIVDATGRFKIVVVNPCVLGENFTDTARPISIGDDKFDSTPPPSP